MAKAGRETVPVALRPAFNEITEITDEFCMAHLDDEYAELCRRLTPKLARKRTSPLVRGDRRIWAVGIAYAIGRVNFLSDPSQQPHLRSDEMAALLGVKPETMGNKGRLIMAMLKISLLDPEWCRQDVIAQHPIVWFVEVNGLVVDARTLPVEIQVEAWRRGLIPYVVDASGKQWLG